MNTPAAASSEDTPIKFLVVAADCEEARRAAFFAARRAKRSRADVTILHIIEPPEFGHWASVEKTMRAEALENAEATLREFAAEVKAQLGSDPETITREGVMVAEIRTLIEEDEQIALLFLGAATKSDGPGPLVSALANQPDYLGTRPIPVVVVPGAATRDELRKLAG